MKKIVTVFLLVLLALSILLVIVKTTYTALHAGVAEGKETGTPLMPNSGEETTISSHEVKDSGLPFIERTIRADDKNYLFGISPGDLTDEEWNMYKEMGLKSIRLHLQKARYTVDPITGAYDFNYYDAICKKAADLGIEIDMLVSYESYGSNGSGGSYTDYAGLVNVLEYAIPHFKKLGVTAYEIWNEQNGNWPVAPENYAELISTVYEKCKYTNKWDVNANIVFGGLDGMSSGRPEGIRPDVSGYLTAFYNSPAYKAFKAEYGRSPFDAIGYHNYQTIDVNNKFELDYNVFDSSLTSITAVMNLYGDAKMPIWLTEIGDNDAVDELQAARLKYYLHASYSNPQVTRMHWFKHTYGTGYSLADNESRFTTSNRLAMTTYKTEIAKLTGTNTQPVTGISLNKTSFIMPYRSSIQLVAILTPFNAVDTALSWTSSDETVATVTNGFIESKKAGMTTITVTAGSYSAACTITVLDSADMSIYQGTYEELEYLVTINASPMNYMAALNRCVRYADRTSTFIYKFNLDQRATKAKITPILGQNYDIWLSADNVNWTEAYRVGTKPLGYGKPIDISSYLKGGTVYLKMGDADTSDGNGGMIKKITLTHTYNSK